MNSDRSRPQPLSMKANVIWNGAGSLVYQGCQWLTTVFVVLLSSGYENSGILAYAMTIGNIFSPIATYNVRTFQVSDVDNRFSGQNYVAFRFITIAMGLMFSMAYAVIVTQSSELVIAVGVYLLFKSDEAFAIVLYGIDQKAYRMDYIGVSQLLRGPASLGAFCILLAATQVLVIAAFGMFLSCLCITLLYDLPHSARFGSIRPAITRVQIVELLIMCLPAVISTLFCGMVVSVTRQYFGNVNGNEALGIYAAIATPSVIIQLLAQYLYSPSLGAIAEKWAHGSSEELRALIDRLFVWMITAILITIAVLSLCGDYLLTLVFGAGIADYTFIFPYVLIGTGLIALVWFCSDVLIVFRKTQYALIANSLNLVVALTFMVPLIGAFGMNGINLTVIVANAAALILEIVLILSCIGRRYDLQKADVS